MISPVQTAPNSDVTPSPKDRDKADHGAVSSGSDRVQVKLLFLKTMKVTIIINGKPTEKEVPTSWEQVTFGQFLELEKCEQDKTKVLSLFTGIDHETLLKAKIKHFDDVMVNGLSFLTTQPPVAIPEKLLGYTMPKNLEFEQVQQYVDLQNYIKESRDKSPSDQLRQYTLYCAVYACIQKHSKYDWKLVEEMAPEFLNAPCTEVMGIGHFTLMRLIASKQGTKPTSPPQSTLLKKLGLVLKSWRLRLVSNLRWIIWSKRLGVKPTKS